MCVNFFTFENNSRLLPSTKTQKYDFNKTRLALINSYTDFYTIKWSDSVGEGDMDSWGKKNLSTDT